MKKMLKVALFDYRLFKYISYIELFLPFYSKFSSECPVHFVSNKDRCYGSPVEKRTWREARGYCRKIADNYDLVSIESENENKFVTEQIVIPSKDDGFWIGLKEDGEKKNYVWVDSSPFKFGSDFDEEIWVKTEPNSVIHCNPYYIKIGGLIKLFLDYNTCYWSCTNYTKFFRLMAHNVYGLKSKL